jgi:HTH-type transcriptional regulator/antitoxin HigA
MKSITTKQEYTAAMQRSEALIAKATDVGGFQNLPQEEVAEFGNIAASAGKYETEVLKLYPFKHESANIISQLEVEMFRRRMKQREMAEFLGISNSRFSEILNGKSKINIQIAKTLHTRLGIDGNVLLENA